MNHPTPRKKSSGISLLSSGPVLISVLHHYTPCPFVHHCQQNGSKMHNTDKNNWDTLIIGFRNGSKPAHSLRIKALAPLVTVKIHTVSQSVSKLAEVLKVSLLHQSKFHHSHTPIPRGVSKSWHVQSKSWFFLCEATI